MLTNLFAPAPLAGTCRADRSIAARTLRFAAATGTALRYWYRRRVTIQRLCELDDRILKDIGLARGEIEGLVRTTDPDRGHRYPRCDRTRFL